MPKKKGRATSIDFDFGIGDIIPSTQEAYRQGVFEGTVRKTEKESLATFKRTISAHLDTQLKDNEQFPSDGEIFVFIVQYFSTKSEYIRRDIDNISVLTEDCLQRIILCKVLTHIGIALY